MVFALLTGLALALIAGAGVVMWRRLELMRAEIAALRKQLAALEGAGAVRRRAHGGETLRLATMDEKPSAVAGSAKVHRLRGAEPPTADAHGALRGVGLALAAAAPALGVFFGFGFATIAALGVALGAAMMLLALRAQWRAAAWAGVVTAGAWAALAPRPRRGKFCKRGAGARVGVRRGERLGAGVPAARRARRGADLAERRRRAGAWGAIGFDQPRRRGVRCDRGAFGHGWRVEFAA